jgi:hypothetical protein
MLDPTPLAPGASYGTAAEIMVCNDLPRMPITPGITRTDGGFEPYWTHADGKPMTLLVRAPSHDERREINAAAGDSDDDFTLETASRCIVFDPPLPVEQAKDLLRGKNPLALEQISATAWQLAGLPAGMVEREVRRLAGIQAKKSRPARGRNLGRGVAKTAEPEVPAPDR